MLELRPNCENCDTDLPPASIHAYICSYECTFCKKCVDTILKNVCPNCGGGFTKRPIRPNTERRDGVSLEYQRASTTRIHSKYNEAEIADFVETVKGIEPKER